MKNKFYFFRLVIFLFISISCLSQLIFSQYTAGDSKNLPGVLKPDEIYTK